MKLVLATPHEKDAIRDSAELASGGHEVGCVSTTQSLLRVITDSYLDAIISELEFPEDPERRFLSAVHSAVLNGTRFLSVTRSPQLETAVLAMRAGAEDYLVRPLPPRTLLHSLDRVGSQLTRPPENSWSQPVSSTLRLAKWDDLSERELQVVDTLYSGYSPIQIAEHLSISQYTVRNHLRSIYAKLGVHSQRELLALGCPQGPALRGLPQGA